MESAKTKVRLKDGFKITRLFNTDAEIKVIIKGVIENARVAIKQRSKLELNLHTCYNKLFLGLCKDIKVAIKGLKTRYLMFVIKIKDYNLILE